jgi:ribosomal protein S18 acetylase RimI-like enzyme
VDLTLRPATAADVQLLADMNRQLCDDERSRNPMTIAELAVRMEKWLSEDWQAVLFQEPSQVVGYALFQIGADYYDPVVPEVYIRQFFIRREHRSRGLGRQAFDLLARQCFPTGARVHLDVLATNPNGQRFWESLGFQSYSTALRLEPGKMD